MTVLVGAGLLAVAALTLVLAFRGGDRSERAAFGLGIADGGTGRQRPHRLSSASARDVHRLLADALENRIDTNRRQGLALRLERAGSNMKPGEWLVLTLAFGVATFLAVTALTGPSLGFVAGGFGMLANHLRLSRQIHQREAAFNAQLSESLQLMSGSLRAGLSLAQTMHNLVTDSPSPSSEEFRRVMTETRLGRDITEALYALAERMNSEDFAWVVGAVDINRTTGGDLAVILDRVSDTIRQRERLRGQVRALSAEGRLSGVVVGLLPPAVFVFVYLTNRPYLTPFFDTGRGRLLLGMAVALLVTGGLWLRKLSRPTF